MKQQQIQKGLFVISIILLIVFYNCKTNKSTILINDETYIVIESLLSNFDSTNPYRKDSIIIIDTILKFKKDDFLKPINMYQNAKDKVFMIPECAEIIYNEFDFNNVLNIQYETNVWNTKKIALLGAKSKSIKEVIYDERYISLSQPLFSLKKDLVLIKGNRGYHGEIIYFLKKIDGIWEVNCELYISHY